MIKYLSLFSGVGAFEKALERQNIEYELIGFSEIDKYAIKSYCAIHKIDESKNYGDISKIEPSTLPDFDLMTWGFPCQDISVAGKGKGIVKGETRSGLYHVGYEILKEKLPQYSIIENVKNLVGKKHRKDFDMILNDIEDLGYNNYVKVLNAKHYGIPQNRERVFIVSIRKDIDTNTFKFPEPQILEKKLKDVLEKEVGEKYFLSEKAIKTFSCMKNRNGYIRGEKFKPHDVEVSDAAFSVTTRNDRDTSNFILIKKAINQAIYTEGAIRKLTPKECWRLMGFDDEDVTKCIEAGISDRQLYKQAGNSIVVNVLQGILSNLLKEEKS